MLLQTLKFCLNINNISQSKNTAVYAVIYQNDIPIIIDHFDKYPLITHKLSDYFIFKECFNKIKKGEHLTQGGLLEILKLKSSLNLGLSPELRSAFPNIDTSNRPKYAFNGIPNPYWISGFTSGEGSFQIVLRGKGFGVFPRFSLHLHVRDSEVLRGIFAYLNSKFSPKCIDKKVYVLEKSASLQISKFSDGNEIIIPFFDQYPILGIKSLDF